MLWGVTRFIGVLYVVLFIATLFSSRSDGIPRKRDCRKDKQKRLMHAEGMQRCSPCANFGCIAFGMRGCVCGGLCGYSHEQARDCIPR